REAVIRALLYIGLGCKEPQADERAFAVLRQVRAEDPGSRQLTLTQFKEAVKEQYLMLRIDQERAIVALPKLLQLADSAERSAAAALIRRAVSAAGEPVGESKCRLERVEALFKETKAPERPLRLVTPIATKPAMHSGEMS